MLLLLSSAFAADPPVEAPPEPAGPTDDAESRAKVLYENGAQLYEEGQYEAAIVAFRSALEAWPAATQLHYNLSNCHERLGQLDQAYAELNLYRATAPAEERETIERRLRALEQRLATAAPARAPAPEPAPVAPAPETASRPHHPRWALVGVGLGVAAAGGVGAGVTYRASRAEIEENDRDEYETTRLLNGLSLGVTGIGAACSVIGFGWQVYTAGGSTFVLSPTGLSGTW